MNKKTVAAMLAGVMVLSLTACGGSGDKKESTSDGGDGADIKVAMVTDSGDITDQSFNQTTYETCKSCSADNDVEFNYYKPESDSDEARNASVDQAVAEGANEVGTVYYSDTFGYEDQLDIIEQLPNSLTGDVIYPVAAVESDHTSDEELEASEDFLTYLQSEEAVKLFEKYHFTVQ